MITDKQRKILKEYLSEENIDKLENKGFKCISSFIDLIFKTAYRDFNECSIDILSETEYTEQEKKEIEKWVNSYKNDYTNIMDEYCNLCKAYVIPEYDKKVYTLRQTWFKGMSDNATHNYIKVFENGENFQGIYNVLIDLEIYSIISFMTYLKRNIFNTAINEK